MLISAHPNQPFAPGYKPLGAYLVEAGLLNDAQVTVALTDQDLTSMSFGEIVVTRGWVKEQTIEYLMQKVILPERKSVRTPVVELESGLVRQGPQFNDRKRVGPGRPPHSPAQVLGAKATTPPTAEDKEGVNWIG
jgi:hypothetical protein